jgi:hypothetical protein
MKKSIALVFPKSTFLENPLIFIQNPFCDIIKEGGINMRQLGRRMIDMTGKRFGKLLVLGFARISDDKQSMWLCQCDCGNTTIVRGFSLRCGDTKSCGCLLHEKIPKNKLPYGESAKHRVFNNYKKQASERGYAFELDYLTFIQITQKPCIYCGHFPSNKGCSYIYSAIERNEFFKFNGVDRIDNTQGYTLDNSAPCCEVCNRAKKDMSLEDFNLWIREIVEYNK